MDKWGAGATGALTGAASGAAIGAPGGPVGAGIGAGVGALVGGIGSFFGASSAEDAADAQQKALDEAMKRLQAFSAQQYTQRMADLQHAMSFYQPAQDYMKSINSGPNAINSPLLPPSYGPRPGAAAGAPPAGPAAPTMPTMPGLGPNPLYPSSRADLAAKK